MRTRVLVVVGMTAILVGGLLTWRLRSAVVLLLISVALASAARPAIDFVTKRWLGRGLASAVVYAGVLAGTAGVLWAVGARVLHEIPIAMDKASLWYERTRAAWEHGGALSHVLLQHLPPPPMLFHAVGELGPWELARRVLGLTASAVDVVGRIVIAVALSIYWNAGREALERVIVSLVPPAHRAWARDGWRAVDSAVGRELGAQIVQGLIVMAVLQLAFMAVGMPFVGLPAVAVAVLRMVPALGAAMAVAVTTVAGLAVGPWHAAAAAVITAVALRLVRDLVERIWLRPPRHSGTIVVLIMVALGQPAGAVGLLFASSLAVAVETIWAQLVQRRAWAARGSGLPALEHRAAESRRELLLIAPAEGARIASIFSRLTHLLAEIREMERLRPAKMQDATTRSKTVAHVSRTPSDATPIQGVTPVARSSAESAISRS